MDKMQKFNMKQMKMKAWTIIAEKLPLPRTAYSRSDYLTFELISLHAKQYTSTLCYDLIAKNWHKGNFHTHLHDVYD
jgi:hypothetical protein